MSTYPQDLSTEKRRTSGLSTRKNDSIRASSFPPRKSPSPDFLAYTHERKQKNKTNKNKTNKTKTKRQNNKTKINNKNRKQNKKNDNE